MQERDWSAFSAFFQDKKNLLITSHRTPDGDAIGSEVAMAHYLRQLGKSVHIVNLDATPKYFRFLDPVDEITIFEPAAFAELLPCLDGGVIVDINEWSRLAELGRAIRTHGLPIACIDHHIPTEHVGTIEMIDTTVSSTGELVFDFLDHSKADWQQMIIDALYTCLLTDTGSFRFSNTSPRTHRIAAHLLSRGARYREVYKQVYESFSQNRIHLAGRLMASIVFECGGKLAWFALPQEMLRESGVQAWEIEGLSELPRSVEGVELSLMFSETRDGLTKVSFRSAGTIPISGLAAAFGGGGHAFAAGATLNEPFEEAKQRVLVKTRAMLNEQAA